MTKFGEIVKMNKRAISSEDLDKTFFPLLVMYKI